MEHTITNGKNGKKVYCWYEHGKARRMQVSSEFNMQLYMLAVLIYVNNEDDAKHNLTASRAKKRLIYNNLFKIFDDKNEIERLTKAHREKFNKINKTGAVMDEDYELDVVSQQFTGFHVRDTPSETEKIKLLQVELNNLLNARTSRQKK
jgi:ATP-dependent protease HslVU (ClpYQ) ATPase subunit